MIDYSLPSETGRSGEVPGAARTIADVFKYGYARAQRGVPSFEDGGMVEEPIPENRNTDAWNSAVKNSQHNDLGFVETIRALLQGQGAAPEDDWQQALTDTGGNVEQAILSGPTPDDQLARLQAARVRFDKAKAHAVAAADAGDIEGAAHSANLAFNYFPTPRSVQFAPSPQGLIAQIGEQGVPISAQQLREVQFDTAFRKGVDSAFRSPPPAQQQQPARPRMAPPAARRERPAEDMWAAEARELGADPKLVAMSHRIFPMVSQNEKRMMWLSGQMQAGATLQSRERQAEAAAGSRVQAADSRAQAQRDVAATRAQSGLDRETIRGQWQTGLQQMKSAAQLEAIAAKAAEGAKNAQVRGAWNAVRQIAGTPGIDIKEAMAALQDQGIDLPALLEATHGDPSSLARPQTQAPGGKQRPAQVSGTDGNTYYLHPDGKYRTRPAQ